MRPLTIELMESLRGAAAAPPLPDIEPFAALALATRSRPDARWYRSSTVGVLPAAISACRQFRHLLFMLGEVRA